MSKALGLRGLVIAVSAAMLLVFAAACGETKTIEVPGETVIVEKEVVKEVQVPGETVIVEKEVVKEVESQRYVKDVWGRLVPKPQYGGTIPLATGWEF